MIECSYQRTDTPPRPAAALVIKGWRTTQDPPIYMGRLTPIRVVDFFDAPLPRDLGSKTNQG